MKELDDNMLAKMASDGNARAFEQLALKHSDTVFRIAYKWCGVREDAEDIAQEVFVKLARKIHYFKPDAQFTTWLYQVTINTAKDFYRKNKIRKIHEENFTRENSEEDNSNNPENNAIVKNAQEILHKLPKSVREAVLLVVGEGLNHKEAARILGCAENTVSWRIFQARKKLKDLYEN